MKPTCCLALVVKNPLETSQCYCFFCFYHFMLPPQKELQPIKNKVQSKDKILQTGPRRFIYFYLKKVVIFDVSEIIHINRD